jgi:hypothetical protein
VLSVRLRTGSAGRRARCPVLNTTCRRAGLLARGRTAELSHLGRRPLRCLPTRRAPPSARPAAGQGRPSPGTARHRREQMLLPAKRVARRAVADPVVELEELLDALDNYDGSAEGAEHRASATGGGDRHKPAHDDLRHLEGLDHVWLLLAWRSYHAICPSSRSKVGPRSGVARSSRSSAVIASTSPRPRVAGKETSQVRSPPRSTSNFVPRAEELEIRIDAGVGAPPQPLPSPRRDNRLARLKAWSGITEWRFESSSAHRSERPAGSGCPR